MAVSTVSKTPKAEGLLKKFRRLVWSKLLGWDFLDEMCGEIGYGEVRIVVHDGKMRDLFIELHVREDR